MPTIMWEQTCNIARDIPGQQPGIVAKFGSLKLQHNTGDFDYSIQAELPSVRRAITPIQANAQLSDQSGVRGAQWQLRISGNASDNFCRLFSDLPTAN